MDVAYALLSPVHWHWFYAICGIFILLSKIISVINFGRFEDDIFFKFYRNFSIYNTLFLFTSSTMVFAELIIFTNILLTVITGLAIPKVAKKSPKDLLESSMESESFLLFEEESSKQIEVLTEEIVNNFLEEVINNFFEEIEVSTEEIEVSTQEINHFVEKVEASTEEIVYVSVEEITEESSTEIDGETLTTTIPPPS